MNIYIIIILLSIYSAIIASINSIYIKNINILNILFIQYFTTFISTIFIYFYLSKNELNEIFTKKYIKLWIFQIILSITSIISWYFYYYSVSITGPAKTQLIYSIVKIITLFIISIYILSNSKLNLYIIIGIILSLLGIYILESTPNYL